MVIIIQQMQEGAQGFSYNPQSSYSAPFTIISQLRQIFTSKPISFPCLFEVYCPYSCKKIKIGVTKDNKAEAMEFNTTTNRTVTFYGNDNIRYLVNKHRPTKKDKKTITGQGWSFLVDVQEKGNVAIFNPYCIDPLQPLSFYTYQKIGTIQLPDFKLQFLPRKQTPSKALKLGNNTVYLSPDMKYIGLNTYFYEKTNENITILNPQNRNQQLSHETKALVSLVNGYLSHYYGELQKIYQLETKGVQWNENFKIDLNVDAIYKQIQYYLHMLEQIRARLMNDTCSSVYADMFKEHPRLYSAYQRLGSFINYGNSKFNPIKLAEIGFFNRSDMLQDLSYVEFPQQEIPSVEQENVKDEQQLRQKLFPFGRLSRNLPFPNIDMNTSLTSMHCQLVSQNEVTHHTTLDPYVAFVDSKFKISLWSAEMMVYKMIQIDATKDQQHHVLTIPTTMKDKQDLHIPNQVIPEAAKQPQKQKETGTQKKIEAEVKPDETKLKELQSMGFSTIMAKKALIQTKNDQIDVVIDCIYKLSQQKPQKKINKEWQCTQCTLKNKAGAQKCQICQFVPIWQDDQQQKRILAEIAQKQKQQKQKQEQQLKAQQQKQQRQKKQLQQQQKLKNEQREKQMQLKKGEIVSIAMARLQNRYIDPFLISILIKLEESRFVVKTFRVGIQRKSLLKFYRIEDENVVSNFNREILRNKTFQYINEMLKNSRNQIQWWVKIFQPASESLWIVVGTQLIQLQGSFSDLKYQNNKLFVFSDQDCIHVYEITLNDGLNQPSFSLKPCQSKDYQKQGESKMEQKVSQKLQNSQNLQQSEITIEGNVEQVYIQLNENIPIGEWKNAQRDKQIKISGPIYGDNLIMSEFLPLKIESFEGSIFSHKYSPASMLEKNSDKNNIYVSNYPNVNFVFKSIDNKPMFIQSAAIISKNVKMNKIYPVSAGLIFTANQLSWFTVAKQKFSNFTKQEYFEWLKVKQITGQTAAFWEPVAYFDIVNQVEVEINYKRIAKYVFLLPTTINKKELNDDVVAVKFDFFGVKGRIQDELPQTQLYQQFKNQGQTTCSLQIYQQDQNKQKVLIPEQNFAVKSAISANTLNFAPKYFENYSNKIPLSTSSVFQIKFKELSSKKVVKFNSKYLKSIRILKTRKTTKNLEKINIKNFAELITVHNKLSHSELQKIISGFKLSDLMLEILKGPSEITHYQNLLNKILNIPGEEKKVLQVMSQVLCQICDANVNVTDVGLKSFLRFYEKLMASDENISNQTIQNTWIKITNFCQKNRNKNYNILRNNYKIDELVLQPGLFSKDYYRLINPNYVDEQKPMSLTSEPQTPINNRVFIDTISNFNYVYYIDTLGHQNISNIDLYFPKIANEQKYKVCIRLSQMDISEKGQYIQKQVFYRYFHEDYLLQLSSKAFKDTEIFVKTHINYMSIPGSVLSGKSRILKLNFNLLLVTTMAHIRFKPIAEPYIILPVINSPSKKQISYTQNPLPKQFAAKFLKQFPESTKHNSSLERMPPHKYAHENKKLLYVVHEFKNKSSVEQVKIESIGKIQKISQNILDKNIVTQTVNTIRINDYAMNYKGLDFAYILMINLMKMFKKLPASFKVEVKNMLVLFDTFIVYESGPIKSQTSSLLIQLYNRLSLSQKNTFAEAIIDNYLINSQKIKSLKIAERYPSQKIIKFLGELALPFATLFEKLRKTQSLSAITILILLITNNQHKAANQQQKQKQKQNVSLDLYSQGKKIKTFKVHELIQQIFRTSIWVLNNASSLSSQILQLNLNLLISFLTDKSSIKVTSDDIKQFIQNLSQEDFWQLIFDTLRKKNDLLNDKIDTIFKILVENVTQGFQKGINNILLQIIRKNDLSLYQKINPDITDEARMNHLQTILQYLSLTNKKIFLDTDTAISLLQLPLTTTLWSLALKIIPREDKILVQIIKKFSQQLYNSLGNEIMQFCQPLAGIRKMESNHINWLQLVRKIRIQGRSVFQLFIQHLKQCNFGGKSGLTMALSADVIQLQIADQFAKLISENKIQDQYFTEENVLVLVSWFFMNYCKQKGSSPATDLLFNLSKNVITIFEKVACSPSIIPKFIKIILQTRKQSEIIQKLFEQKKISSINALELNKRFSQCFQFLINLLCVNDELFNYFAFEIQGLQYLLQKSGLSNTKITKMKSLQGQAVSLTLPEQQFLISQGLISSSKDLNQPADKSVSSVQLKQEQFATNVQLVPNKNLQGITSTVVDWTSYKKGNKSKVLFLPMNGVTHNEFPLYISFNQASEVRSIKIGFPAASFELNDKIIASPSLVLLEGGMDLKNMETLGQMEEIDDDGYTCNGVRVFVLNLQKMKKSQLHLTEAVTGLNCFRVKYLKIVIKRPVVTFIQGQYSPLNGKPYTNLGVSISFVSVLGDNIQKRKLSLLNHCKQISKSSALTLLGTVINETNCQTVKRISHSDEFVMNFKNKFNIIKQHMGNYSSIVPNIVYSLGSANQQLGDWIIDKFLSEGNGDIQAKLLNQIVTSSPAKIYDRLDIFLKHILSKIRQIVTESDIESNIKFSQSLFFVQSFCKTLQQSYQFGIQEQKVLHCTYQNVEQIIALYDKKYSSPEIKTFSRLLINLLYLRSPLKLSEDVRGKALNLVWENCSQAKPYFYQLLGALLLNKNSREWIVENDHEKIKKIIASTHKAIQSNSFKIVQAKIYLLWIISFHEKDFILKNGIHLQLYNKLKNLVLSSFQIYENLLRLMQNVVLDKQEEQRLVAEQLIQDVDLLVKRRDPNLQHLYVGLLRLEKQVHVNLKGFDVDSRSKKETFLITKILNKAHLKTLGQKINKKIKFNLAFQSESNIKSQFYNKILESMNASQFLIVIKLKLVNGKNGYIGCYSPGRSFRSEEDSYCWEDVINYEKGSFIFYISQGETKFIQNAENSKPMISLSGGQDQLDEFMIFHDFHDKDSEIVKIFFNNTNQNVNNLPGFSGSQIQSVQVFNGVIRPSTMQPKMLATSSKSPVPFNYYRTSSIYVFPHRIAIEKFLNIIGIKGKCCKSGRKLSLEDTLGNLSEQSDDYIIDISIQAQEPEDSSKQDQGYFPIMKVFDKFSELGGVNKVLEIGSQSIKDWRKPQRKKCFEHYMSELRNFVHLPTFFNHYIKNHQSITFLFQIASGMPDEPYSQKNWQQEQVKSSKFIYKILADIYKFDKSNALRDMEKYSQFFQLILDKLAEISKQSVRNYVQEESQAAQASQKQKEGQKQKPGAANIEKKKKKGIGYSSDNNNQNSSKWSAAEWLQYKKTMNQEIQRVTSIIVSFLDCEKPLTDLKLAQNIKNSCLLPLIETALRSSSLLSISKELDLFKSYLNIIKCLAANPATISCLLQIDPKYKPSQTESILKLLTKLHGISEIFIDCLKSGKTHSNEDQVAAVLASQIEKTYNIVDKAVKNISKGPQALSIKQINSMPIGQAYRYLLSGLRFGYVDMKKKQQYAHFYSSSISKGSPPTAKILRLSQQLADLSSSLPCQHTNSIFVRCDKTRIDVIKILIMGSKDTPYSNGAFMFDLFCDDSYPNNPPKMSITTTGSGKIRFNPNLYACGKVCLSLLGTWRGQASQNWDAKISTLLQLFISTQGITMSQDLYFNQPGFDSEQGTVQGQKKNQAYSNIVKLGNVRFAMIDQIKNPPKGFEDIVSRHFYVKRKQILEQVQKWIEQASTKQASYVGLVNDHNNSWCNDLKAPGKYKQLLQKDYEQLKTLLQNLPEPNLKQKQEQVATFETQKQKKKVKAKQAKLGQIDVSYEMSVEKQLSIQENVMQDRWSRYIGAMGIEAVKKQAQSKVILIGLKPLGLEIAKNLVLSGLKQLCIVDQGEYGFGIEEHFYMADVKTKKIQDCIFKIKQLNPYMLVKCQKQVPNLQGYHLIVSTQPFGEALQISKKCRKQGIKFIYAQTCGVSGLYFSDFGNQFLVDDPNGDQPFEGMIKQITCGQDGVVTLLEGVKHSYQDGDYVVIDKVDGMKQKEIQMQQQSNAQVFYNKMSNTQPKNSINGKVFQIKVLSKSTFSIGDTTNYQPYIKGGLCKNINIPKKREYLPMQQCIADFEKHLDPDVGIYDFEKMGDNYSVFASFQAYSQFILKNKRKPKNWEQKDAEQFQAILSKIATNAKKSQQQIQSIVKFGRKYALVSQAQLPVIGAYFGGIVSQQVIKAITNKYTPIKQFFSFHFNELLQEIPENSASYANLQIKQNESFPNLKIIIGRQNSKKVQQMKTFVIGAGAIGCQLLKNFAMVNMGAEGMITVTDPDHIETSNLTRQFLFRQKHVKKPKSATAAATLIQMNPYLKNHISARLDKVSEQTEDIYSDQFFEAQTVVANALDNVKARVYIDSRCVANSKPLFESGTLGPKGHVQVIVPHKTENYGNQTDPTEQNQIPHCTLKMFPEETVHCIEWSRDIFGKVFTLNPKALKKVIEAKDVSAAQGQQKATIAKMIQYKPANFDECVGEAVRKFYKYFRNNVRQLLHTYPLDMKTKDGNLFWTLPKRPPKQISLIDEKDPVHQKFISSYAVLLAKIYQIPFPKDFRSKQGLQKIIAIAKGYKPQQFTPSEQQSQKLQKMAQKQQKQKPNIMKQTETQITQAAEQPKQTNVQINLTPQVLEMQIKPQQFEKDQDSNGHIDLIYSMSNLRARNYGLHQCTWIQSKLKAGKIMAALSTTTSVVSALQTIEIVKLIVGTKSHRNAFINLAVPLIQISEPGEAPKHKIGNTEFTVWDTWEFKAVTLKDLLKQIEQKCGAEGYNISTAGGVPIYWQTMYVGKESAAQQLLNRPLQKIFPEKSALSILMRSKQGDKKSFESVPRIVVIPPTAVTAQQK